MLGPLVAEMQTPRETGLEETIKGLNALSLKLLNVQVGTQARQKRPLVYKSIEMCDLKGEKSRDCM